MPDDDADSLRMSNTLSSVGGGAKSAAWTSWAVASDAITPASAAAGSFLTSSTATSSACEEGTGGSAWSDRTLAVPGEVPRGLLGGRRATGRVRGPPGPPWRLSARNEFAIAIMTPQSREVANRGRLERAASRGHQ